MNLGSIQAAQAYQAGQTPAAATPGGPLGDAAGGELRQRFDAFVGETFYGQLLKSMRSTQGKPAYFHGGRAEEVFQSQLDQTLASELTKASAEQFTGPMFELFTLNRA